MIVKLTHLDAEGEVIRSITAKVPEIGYGWPAEEPEVESVSPCWFGSNDEAVGDYLRHLN